MKQILIIDDEPQIRMMLKKRLETEGYSVIVASNGKEGIKIFNKGLVGLIITDIIMPEKEGMETIMELRKSNPAVPIYAMSGGGKNPSDGYLKTAKCLGAKAIFAKPFETKKLVSAVKMFESYLTKTDETRESV